VAQMNNENRQQESLADQTIKRYRGTDSEERALKRKRFTGGMFIANIVLIIILYALFSSKNDIAEYQTSAFNYKDLQFRLSMTRDPKTQDFIFSLSTRPAGEKNATVHFNANMADLVISYGPTVIVKKTMGENITALDLKPGDSDVRNTVIERYELKLYADAHPESVIEKRGSVFRPGRPYLPLIAEVRIHADQPLATTLKFNYEVDR
jgi:hypothetical protein